MDASASEIRAWARANGHAVNDKGGIPGAVREAYSAAHNGGPAPGPDYPPGMTDDDFETAEAEIPDDDDMREVPPRPVSPKVTPRSTAQSLTGRFKRGSTSGKRKTRPKHPRVSTADLIGSAWRIGAKVLQPLPPLYRVVRLQSEIAGPMLDGQVKGTFVDPVLQVLARHYQAGETMGALLGPNMGIAAAMWHQTQCAKQGVEPNPVIMQACEEVTRYGLKSMMHLGGEAMAARIAAEREEEEKYGATVDMLLEWIMSPPADRETEEANMAAAAAAFAGQPVPEPAAV